MEIQDDWSETASPGSARVGYSGPLSGPLVTNNKKSSRNSSKRSVGFKDEDECYVEITLDVHDDTVSVQNIKGGDSETAYLASRLQRKKSASLGSQLSFKLRQMASSSKKPPKNLDRTKSGAARALKGLKFMTKNVGHEGWSEIEKRFHELAADDGTIPKSKFGQCIGK